MRVSTRHLNGFVAHQFLDSPQRHAAHNQTACKGVPQVMPVKIRDSGLRDRFIEPFVTLLIGDCDVAEHSARLPSVACNGYNG